ncbi:hypothetical protein VTK26DRAFT_20 [Humicola hyalothermophila]
MSHLGWIGPPKRCPGDITLKIQLASAPSFPIQVSVFDPLERTIKISRDATDPAYCTVRRNNVKGKLSVPTRQAMKKLASSVDHRRFPSAEDRTCTLTLHLCLPRQHHCSLTR